MNAKTIPSLKTALPKLTAESIGIFSAVQSRKTEVKPSTKKKAKSSNSGISQAQVKKLLKALKAEMKVELQHASDRLYTDFMGQLQTVEEAFTQQLSDLRQSTKSGSTILSGQNVHDLNTENQRLIQDNQALKAQLQTQGQELEQLRLEHHTMLAQLTDAQAKLDGFRQLLMDSEAYEAQALPRDDQLLKADLDPAVTPMNGAIKRGRRPGKAMQRAQLIFDAVREWNRIHPTETFAINPGLLEATFRVHRLAAKTFCQAFQGDIWKHHADIGVENAAGHNRGKDVEELRRFVGMFLG